MRLARWLTCGIDPMVRVRFRRLFLHPADTLHRMLKLIDCDSDDERRLLLQNLALNLPESVRQSFQQEIDFLSQQEAFLGMFPYPVVRPSQEIASGIDADNGLPYVLHKGRRFYSPKGVSLSEQEQSYRYFVETEGILGGGCLAKSPHSYVSESFGVEENDIVVDVGCSDGLFAFDNANKARKIYLFEAWPYWRRALQASFAPYAAKCEIITKYVGDGADGHSVKLEKVIHEADDSHYFIKMDIEGAEREVLESSTDFLRHNKVKLAVCCYHRQRDAEWLSSRLAQLGFSVSFSDGYMLPLVNGIRYPYFRRGVLYARNF